MPRYEYVLNLNTKRLHLRVDGRSDERCNLDQMESSIASHVPPSQKHIRCTRCMPADGSTPVGPVNL